MQRVIVPEAVWAKLVVFMARLKTLCAKDLLKTRDYSEGEDDR